MATNVANNINISNNISNLNPSININSSQTNNGVITLLQNINDDDNCFESFNAYKILSLEFISIFCNIKVISFNMMHML